MLGVRTQTNRKVPVALFHLISSYSAVCPVQRELMWGLPPFRGREAG